MHNVHAYITGLSCVLAVGFPWVVVLYKTVKFKKLRPSIISLYSFHIPMITP